MSKGDICLNVIISIMAGIIKVFAFVLSLVGALCVYVGDLWCILFFALALLFYYTQRFVTQTIIKSDHMLDELEEDRNEEEKEIDNKNKEDMRQIIDEIIKVVILAFVVFVGVFISSFEEYTALKIFLISGMGSAFIFACAKPIILIRRLLKQQNTSIKS
jgi:hypothetical protein